MIEYRMPEPNPSTRRDWALWYLEKWLLVPYLWQGNDFAGMDCSGLAVEYLQSVGILPHKYDATADQLYHLFKDCIIDEDLISDLSGCLVFWFDEEGVAIHVGIIIYDRLVISATGGGRRTDSKEDAELHNAFVKMRPLNYRKEPYKIVDPFKLKR